MGNSLADFILMSLINNSNQVVSNNLLSIIITVYNAERFIADSVNSILQQTLDDFMLIIVDDGSTDATKEIIKGYSDDRILFISEKHNGRSASLNIALSRVSTPFVAFMDADDIALGTRLEKQLDFLLNNPDVGVISSAYYVSDKDKRFVRVVHLPQKHTEIEFMMTTHCAMRFPAAMIRTELLRKENGFDESLNSAIDYDLFLRLLPKTTFNNLNEPLLIYRRHSNTITNKLFQEQNSNVLKLSKRYLERQHERNQIAKAEYLFRLGMVEYYHGTMKNARRNFMQSIREGMSLNKTIRYLLPTYLGETFFSIYRSAHNKLGQYI
jgi:glycosyltransferase involved in cell wall biosynthesis